MSKQSKDPTKEREYRSTDREVMNDEKIMEILERLRRRKAPTSRTGYELNHEEWRKGLKDYPDKEYRDNILRMNRISEGGGWPMTANAKIEAKGPEQGYKGTIEFWRKALELMEKRMRSGYFLGPFREGKPLPHWLTKGKPPLFNPMFGKEEEKPDGSTKLRLLYDLSNDESGPSLNDCIKEEEKTVTYITILDVIRRIIDCDMRWVWALDALEAYYRVPIQDRFIRLLGVKVCGMMFFITCLVMGMASACKLYTEFADVVCWIIMNNEKKLFHWKEGNGTGEGRVKEMLMHYIDDFIGGARSRRQAEKQFEAVRKWWRRLNIPTQDRKCAPPAHEVRYLGFLINAARRTVRVPKDKVRKYAKKLRRMKSLFEYNRERPTKRRKVEGDLRRFRGR